MYQESVIETLSNRIAFSSSLDPDFPVELSEENSTGTSGRTFDWFHSLVTIDNIYAALPQMDLEEADFNDVLKEMKVQAVLEVLPKIIESNKKHVFTTDYTTLIEDNVLLIDSAIGYAMAAKVIELLVTTQRINAEERSNKLSYSTLKIELDGIKNDKGHIVSKGIVLKLQKAIANATNAIFPMKVIVKSQKIW